MEITRHDICEETTLPPKSNYLIRLGSQRPPLLRLPVELRLDIYDRCLNAVRCPRPKDVHEYPLSAVWKDSPSPLLRVNSQIRAEVIDLLQRCPIWMRVTWQDVKFDSLGLTAYIAQKRGKENVDTPNLQVEIWPPHPDRPIDMYKVWRLLRRLRNTLRATRNLTLRLTFLEDDIANLVS